MSDTVDDDTDLGAYRAEVTETDSRGVTVTLHGVHLSLIRDGVFGRGGREYRPSRFLDREVRDIVAREGFSIDRYAGVEVELGGVDDPLSTVHFILDTSDAPTFDTDDAPGRLS
jgi:hypothetical protein